jgi:uncharacterized damage-inducible protein DinB
MQKLCFVSALIAVCLIMVAPLDSAAGLSQGDRDYAMSSLHASRKLFLDSVAGLSDAQWNFKPAPDRWSIAQCAEHIALSEDYLMSNIRNKILASPAQPDKRLPENQARSRDQQVENAITDRSHKAQAPQALRPDQHKFASPQKAVEHFRQARDANIRWIETTTADLRAHFAPHPAVGQIDAYEWVLLMSAHTLRHTDQIKEVKADARFPKR